MSWQQLNKQKDPASQVVGGRRPWLLLLCLLVPIMAVTMLAGGRLAAAPEAGTQDGACLAWDISGQWQYQASLGGYGQIVFQQKENGDLTGTFYNAASGGSGTISGQINGAAVRFTSSADEYFEGTLDSTGRTIAGTFPDGSTLEAKGTARCTRYEAAPVAGTSQITVFWGPHIYRRLYRPGTQLNRLQTQQQSPPPGVPVIRFLGETKMVIDLVLFGENLPNSLQVIDRVNNQTINLNTLVRIGETPEGGVRYRGTVTVNPAGPIAPGQIEIHDVIIIGPGGQQIFAAQVIMNLIDPSGYIYDANSKAKLEGATVSCYVRQNGQWILWDAAFYAQENPQTSNSAGHYGWDVPQGQYKVRASKPCYRDTESAVLEIPPPRTDVHLGMQPLDCASVTIDNLWTSDDSSFAASRFRPGQEVEVHVVVNNSGNNDKKLTINWATNAPNGEQVKPLSGSGDYTIQPGSALDIKIGGALPQDAPAGPYILSAQLTDQEQTSLKITRFEVMPRIHLPLILHNYKGSIPPPPKTGISGKITAANQTAAGVPLDLRRYGTGDEITVDSATTNAQGIYRFNNAPTLGQGQTYYVRYGPNGSDPTRVAVWFGPDIDHYTSGTAAAGGDFDIANVALNAPDNRAAVSFPVTFRWQPRGVPGDSYELVIFDPDSDRWWHTDNLGDANSFTLNALADGMVSGKAYGWYIMVYRQEDSYGISYYYREVSFQASSGQKETGSERTALQPGTGQPRGLPVRQQTARQELREDQSHNQTKTLLRPGT